MHNYRYDKVYILFISFMNLIVWLRIQSAQKILIRVQFFMQIYRIYSAIRRGFHLSRMTTNNLSVLCNFAIIQVLPFQNNPKDLDPSYKMDLDLWKTDLDLWDCFGSKKNPSYIQGNTVLIT